MPFLGVDILTSFIEELNFENSNYFFNPVVKIGLEMENANLELQELLKNVCDNHYLSGHIPISMKNDIIGFKLLFIYDDLLNSIISFCLDHEKRLARINADSNNEIRGEFDESELVSEFIEVNGKKIFQVFNEIVPWINHDDVLHINYEKLKGSRGRGYQLIEFKAIIDYLGIELTGKELETKIGNALNASTPYNYKEKIQGDLSFYRTKKLDKFYRKMKFQDLNRKLGFDKKRGLLNRLIKNKSTLSFYDKYWKQNKTNSAGWNYGINIVQNLINNYEFKTVLDAGCGSGDVVRCLIDHGYEARGIELSSEVLRNHASDLYKKNIVQQGSLLALPFPDNSFDVVFSSEVLEHIPEMDIPFVASELNRVAKKVVFMTISLRPSSNFNLYHITLKPRKWWEQHFLNLGLKRDERVINSLQKKISGASTEELLQYGPTKTHIHEMEWFIKADLFDFNEEAEPWYFIFKKK